MNAGHVVVRARKVLCSSVCVVALAQAATAAEISGFDWTGAYVGAHVGYSRGMARALLADPSPSNLDRSFGSLGGGLQVGANCVLPSRWLVGIEADVSFLNALAADDVAWSRTTAATDIAEKIDAMGTLRGRIGYAFDRWMLYGTGGFAWALSRFLQTPGVTADVDKKLHLRSGWTLGAGAEIPLDASWAARVEYLYRRFGSANVAFPSGAAVGSSIDVHTVRAGLNYKLGSTRADTTKGDASATPSAGWEIHGQTTYIQQGYPAFHSPYFGGNSLTPWAQTRNTWSASAFFGLKLWDGAEFYYNPELLQGFGLNATTGAAGFPNGEAQKSNFPYPRYNTSRLYMRQTFGFGGGEETVESSYGQMAGKRDVSRLAIQVGKFAVHDVFDNNAYAQDSRADFLNWSIWAAGAFDYPADRIGLTYGAVAELNQRQWAWRVGYFLAGNVPNGNEFDTALLRRGAYVGEFEARYSLFSRPGKLRMAAWANTYLSGSYREVVDLTIANPGLDPNNTIAQTRQGRTKYGYYLNAEQAVTDDVGLFGRWSWNNGKNEVSAFTDIDWSLSGGVAVSGRLWDRPGDKVGIAGAINGLSKDHRDFLAIGGLGILIGDGRLNYRPEKILETYYAIGVTNGVTVTLDYQFMMNPGDNADRGPISFISARAHAEF